MSSETARAGATRPGTRSRVLWVVLLVVALVASFGFGAYLGFLAVAVAAAGLAFTPKGAALWVMVGTWVVVLAWVVLTSPTGNGTTTSGSTIGYVTSTAS